MIKFLPIMWCVLATFPAESARAQEASSTYADDSVERSYQPDNTTEAINTNRNSYFGFGGQKPMQRMSGIPLPGRQNRMAANTPQAAGSAGLMRDAVPTFSARRAKPIMGDLTTDFPARMIYLNGKNVSSVREQQLDGVNVRIDSNGNIHITGAHYEVQESTHYRPLLPQELPRLSKPEVNRENPDMTSRQSKNSMAQDAGGAVPPVDSGESEPAAPTADRQSGRADNPVSNSGNSANEAKPAAKSP